MASVDVVIKLEIPDEALTKLAEALGAVKPEIKIPEAIEISFTDFGGKIKISRGEK